jgi:hypothetical protein
MRILFAALATLFIALFTQVSIAQAQETENAAPPCSVASEGIYRGSWVKHRIYINDDVVYGANDIGSILNQLENLRGQGLCR